MTPRSLAKIAHKISHRVRMLRDAQLALTAVIKEAVALYPETATRDALRAIGLSVAEVDALAELMGGLLDGEQTT